jgi:glycosyltransferase involved in cell wall biosynthesis
VNGVQTIVVYHRPSKAGQHFAVLNGLRAARDALGTPDIIHAHMMFPAGTIARKLNKFAGIPYVFTEHTGPFELCYPTDDLKARCVDILSHAEFIMPDSRTHGRDIMKIYDHPEKYVYVTNVVDTKKFYPYKHENPVCKIVHTSLLQDERKDVSGLIQTVAELYKKRQDFVLVIVGDGPDRPKLEALAESLDLREHVIFFAGSVSDDELSLTVRNSDFFIINSKHENFCVACAEALACGIPVVAPVCGGPEEYVTPEQGIIFQHGDLYQAMDKMLDTYKSYDGDKLHEYAVKKFSAERAGKDLFDVYQKVWREKTKLVN